MFLAIFSRSPFFHSCRKLPRSMNKCGIFRLLILVLLPVHITAVASTNVWSINAGSKNNSSPALSPDGTLYFGSGDHKLYAVSTNQYIKWTFETGLQIKCSPAIADDGTIYIGSRDRKFYAVTAEGKLKWSFPTDGWVDSSPAIAPDGTVYFGSWDKKFYALNPNGVKKWVFNTAGEIDSSPAIAADGTIYFGSHDKKLYALEPSGAKKWEFATGGPITSSPAIDYSGNIYFSSVDGWFYVLKSDGTVNWKLHTGGITESSPVLANDGAVYICINNSRGGISPDHKVLPIEDVPFWIVDSTPALGADGRIFYATPDGLFSALDNRGLIVWSLDLKVSFLGSPLLSPDGVMYDTPWFGPLKAVTIGTPLMQSSWPMFRANPRHTGVVNSPAQ
jgi:outer membrane protein assembly factor BamB